MKLIGKMKTNCVRIILLCLMTMVVGASAACSCTETGGPDAGQEPGSGGEEPGGGSQDGELHEGLLTPDMESELRDYFSDVLTAEFSDEIERFGDKSELELKYAEDNAGLVWKAWKDANDDFAEEKLIDVGPLSQGVSGRWTLPSGLEPSAVMPYYFGSKGVKPEEGWPLFLYMHGSGDKDGEWATGLTLCREFEDAPSLYFIPQIPNEGEWYRWWQKSKQYAWEKLLRLAFVSGEVNPDRVYFFGISEGGYGSQRLASFYADYLAGAGPMAGGEPLKNAPAENCANIAFSLRTGADDTGFGRNTLTGYTSEEFDRLEQKHPGLYVHNIELIPGYGHAINYYLTTPWLADYVRNPWPKYFCWENYEMDGRYRDGFYNVQVLERSNPDMSMRTVYEMTVSGNAVNMSVQNVAYETTETMNGIEMKFSKTYSPVTSGKFRIYLNSHLVDLSQPVTVRVNGETAFEGMVEPRLDMMAESCALFGDPQRVFPCGVDIDMSEL